MDNEFTVIPKLFRTYYDVKADLDVLIGLRDGELAYATDENILYRQNGTGAANWIAVSSPSVACYNIRRYAGASYYSMPSYCWSSNGSVALIAGRKYFIPIYVGESKAYDRIGFMINIAAAGGSLARLGIYNNGKINGTNYPTTLLVDAGTLPTDVAVGVEAVIAQTLTGIYWLCLVADNTPTVMYMRNTLAADYWFNSVFGYYAVNAPSGAVLYNHLATAGVAAEVAGGLSDPAVITVASSADVMPIIQLREV